MSQHWRLRPTAQRLGRVLQFPRVDQYGQYDLFPPSPVPDRFSPSQVIINYTLLQYRITRIASDLSPHQRLDLIGQCQALLLAFVEPAELYVAQMRERELARQQRAIA